MKKIEQLVLDNERILDLLHDKKDIIGYFSLVLAHDGSTCCKYDSDDWVRLSGAVDLMLLDIKMNLVHGMEDKTGREDDE